MVGDGLGGDGRAVTAGLCSKKGSTVPPQSDQAPINQSLDLRSPRAEARPHSWQQWQLKEPPQDGSAAASPSLVVPPLQALNASLTSLCPRFHTVTA